MRRTMHKLRTQYPLAGTDDGLEVEIRFTFLKGAPEQGPSYASGGQPADPDEVEVVSVKAADAEQYIPLFLQEAMELWADEWIAEEGFSEAQEVAASDYEAAREYAAELRRDR